MTDDKIEIEGEAKETYELPEEVKMMEAQMKVKENSRKAGKT